MAKKTIHDNYRVVVEPRRLGDMGWASVSDRMMCGSDEAIRREYRERCHEIAAEIKRSIDNVYVAHVEFDTLPECEHCGSRWTEESTEYNGGCCSKDQIAQDEREAAPT